MFIERYIKVKMKLLNLEEVIQFRQITRPIGLYYGITIVQPVKMYDFQKPPYIMVLLLKAHFGFQSHQILILMRCLMTYQR